MIIGSKFSTNCQFLKIFSSTVEVTNGLTFLYILVNITHLMSVNQNIYTQTMLVGDFDNVSEKLSIIYIMAL